MIDSKACRLSERAKRPFDPSFRLDRVKREKKKLWKIEKAFVIVFR